MHETQHEWIGKTFYRVTRGISELEEATTGAGRAVLTPAGPERGCHEVRAVGSTAHRLAASCDFAMNFGMFWMSTGLLVPILPFFTVFAF